MRSNPYLFRGILAGLSGVAGAMLGRLVGFWLGLVYLSVFMPNAELEGIVPVLIWVSIGTIMGIVAGIAWLPHVIRFLSIRSSLILFLVAVFWGGVQFHLHQGIGFFTFVLLLAAGLGLLCDFFRWYSWPVQ